jgi:hypothetical protein
LGTVLNFLVKVARNQRKYVRRDFIDSLFKFKVENDLKYETNIDPDNEALKEIGTFLVPVISTVKKFQPFSDSSD